MVIVSGHYYIFVGPLANYAFTLLSLDFRACAVTEMDLFSLKGRPRPSATTSLSLVIILTYLIII